MINEGEFFKELWDAAKTAGPFGMLLLLFILYMQWKEKREERAARIKLEEERAGWLERVINGLHTSAAAINENSKMITLFDRRKE